MYVFGVRIVLVETKSRHNSIKFDFLSKFNEIFVFYVLFQSVVNQKVYEFIQTSNKLASLM